MIAVLLCAGYATRMGDLTKNFPKSLLDVAGKPVMDYLMQQIADYRGFDKVYVVTNNKYHEKFLDWQENWNSDVNMKVVSDGTENNEERLGSIGDTQYIFKVKNVKPQKFFVAASDNIFRFDLSPFWKVFQNNKYHYVFGLHETDKTKLRRWGVLDIRADNLVRRLHEKPKVPPSEYGCPAAYFYQASAFPLLDEYIKIKDNHDAPGHFVDYLCQKEKVYAFKLNKKRLDIGNIDDYNTANEILSKEPVF